MLISVVSFLPPHIQHQFVAALPVEKI